jgi:hypothetical protein
MGLYPNKNSGGFHRASRNWRSIGFIVIIDRRSGKKVGCRPKKNGNSRFRPQFMISFIKKAPFAGKGLEEKGKLN